MLLGALFFTLTLNAQTYTTKADGNWSSASTWVGGKIPTNVITSGVTVNINHDVTFDIANDLDITGKLLITNDTLRFPSSYDKKVLIKANGLINVKSGGFIQSLSRKGELNMTGGRFALENAKASLSKNLIANVSATRSFKNSYLLVGEKYEIGGTSTSLRAIDTIKVSTIEIGGDYIIKDFATTRVDNAKIILSKGSFKNAAKADIAILSGAAKNFGFVLLKVSKNLENEGGWDARIDAYCIGEDVKGKNASLIDFSRPQDCNVTTNSAPKPELVFSNPVLVKGTANKPGAEYLFSSILPGIDAVLKVKKFSRSDIQMKTVDNSEMGWKKALQPEFGLPGIVKAYQNWNVDFEMSFYEAGKNKKVKLERIDFTALDVDGDGNSISEYIIMKKPDEIKYSPVSHLKEVIVPDPLCGVCSIASNLKACVQCDGDGYTGGILNTGIFAFKCGTCKGSGKIHSGCSHPWNGSMTQELEAPVTNYSNIDTAGTAVMASYTYYDKDALEFQIGAKSGAKSSDGSGIRLNSLWFREFSLQAPPTTLPVKLTNFQAVYNQNVTQLTWATAEEKDFSHFVIERSTNGKDYKDIALVFTGGGNQATYAYKDKVSGKEPILYYRLRCVDLTKEFTYSAVRVIRLSEVSNATALTAFPNPVDDQVKLTLPTAWQGKDVQVEVYTNTGIKVHQVQLSNVNLIEVVNLQKMSKGVYIIKAIADNQSVQTQIIKK
jgi:hypothetical protein